MLSQSQLVLELDAKRERCWRERRVPQVTIAKEAYDWRLRMD